MTKRAVPVNSTNQSRLSMARSLRIYGMGATLDQLFDSVTFFQQFLMGGVHALSAEIVEVQALDDLIVAVFAGDGVAIDHAGGDAIATVGGYAHTDPVVIGRAFDP